MSSSDPDEPMVLTETLTGFEAETIASALEAHGITAKTADTATNMTWGGVAGGFARAKVMVRRADLERAQNALRALKAESIDIDWDELDVGDEEPAGPGRGLSRWLVLAIAIMVVSGALMVSIGARSDSVALKTIGAIVFAAGGVVAVLRVFLPGQDDEEKKEGEEEAEEAQKNV